MHQESRLLQALASKLNVKCHRPCSCRLARKFLRSTRLLQRLVGARQRLWDGCQASTVTAFCWRSQKVCVCVVLRRPQACAFVVSSLPRPCNVTARWHACHMALQQLRLHCSCRHYTHTAPTTSWRRSRRARCGVAGFFDTSKSVYYCAERSTTSAEHRFAFCRRVTGNWHLHS